MSRVPPEDKRVLKIIKQKLAALRKLREEMLAKYGYESPAYRDCEFEISRPKLDT